MKDSLVPGSKIEVFAKPVKGISPLAPLRQGDPYPLVPPLIKTLPSCMIDMPLQNMSHVVGMW